MKRTIVLSALCCFALAACGGGTTSTVPARAPGASASHARSPQSATLTFNVYYYVCPGTDQAGTIDEGVQTLGDIRSGNLQLPYLPQGSGIGFKPPLATQVTNFDNAHTSYADSTTVQVNLQVFIQTPGQGYCGP